MNWNIRALAVFSALAVSTAAAAKKDETITCPEPSSVKLSAPSGWKAYNPDKFLAIYTSGGHTGVVCAYGINRQDVKMRIGVACPTGQKSVITGEKTAVCKAPG